MDLAVSIILARKPSLLHLLLPLEGDQEEELKARRPLCDASFIDDLTNESLAPNASEFWANIPQWLRDRKVLLTEYRVINGLDKVKDINEALDTYQNYTRVGVQTVVRI